MYLRSQRCMHQIWKLIYRELLEVQGTWTAHAIPLSHPIPQETTPQGHGALSLAQPLLQSMASLLKAFPTVAPPAGQLNNMRPTVPS